MGDRAGSIPVIRSKEVVIFEKSKIVAFFLYRNTGEKSMVSIILCTFNRAHMLRETLASILAQTYTDFELLIIDDGSTDHTQELLSEYKDMRIRSFVLEENHFYCAAANFGMTKARGEYIAFATSDDLWEPKKLEKQIAYLEKRKDCGACFTYVHIIDENGENADDKNQALFEVLRKTFYTRRDWVQRFIFDGNCLCHPTAVVRREVMEKVGGYNLYYSLLADMELWLRIVRYYPIHVVEEGLVEYRYFENGKQQLSGIGEKKITKSLNEHMMIRRNFLTDLTDEEMLEFFADCFQYKEALSHQELEIEKAFLLMSCVRDLPELRILGMEKLSLIHISRNGQGRKSERLRWNRCHDPLCGWRTGDSPLCGRRRFCDK